MKKSMIVFLLLLSFLLVGVDKKPLTHKDYDSWKNIRNQIISNDGIWVSYSIDPQKGDGILYLKNLHTKNQWTYPRGSEAKFSPQNKYLVFKIKPKFKETRQAKKDKKKKDELPKNDLGIWVLGEDKPSVISRVKSFKIPEKQGLWMAYLLEKPKKENKDKVDQTKKDKNLAKKTDEKKLKTIKSDGTELILLNPLNSNKHSFKHITKYAAAPKGGLFIFLEEIKKEKKQSSKDKKEVEKNKKDKDKTSTIISKVQVFNASTQKSGYIFQQEGIVKQLITDQQGKQLAFTFTDQQKKNKAKIFSLYYLAIKNTKPQKLIAPSTPGMTKKWSVSPFYKPWFSDKGTRLFFGTAPSPIDQQEEDLLDEEKYQVDVWSWHDDTLQPMQKKNIKQLKEKNYLAVYHFKKKKMVQLADKNLNRVSTIQKGDGNIALGISDTPYRRITSWDITGYSDVYEMNIMTGTRTKIFTRTCARVRISPAGKYLYWYHPKDRQWYAKLFGKKQIKSFTAKLKIPFHNILHDSPSLARPYGSAGWTKGDKFFLIYDEFDIWKIDPLMKSPPTRLTKGIGRKNNTTFRYIKLDLKALCISPKSLFPVSVFHKFNKKSGIATLPNLQIGSPTQRIFGDFSLSRIKKAKNKNTIIWTKENFEEYPDLYASDFSFNTSQKLTTANPQQKNFLWGTNELVEWTAFNRKKLQGILYKPENFDPKKKYPMVVYFYERGSDGIHRHWAPSPSASIINRTMYTSNGYLVFVTDIPYLIGYPGDSCYKAVVSGTMAMINKYPFIDKDRIGLNGQSWGGYQIAYLVTRTDLFTCAFSGAPVSNMTSAYGGIRWGSGMSRMFQYEQTQSRIGGTLWEKPFLYIENSPIFFIPKINTPLLIMHNDNDGAVPWYQGIEFFVSLRRLNKPAWMLVYNKEAHNLRKRPNRVDLSIRTMQFYDFYLKDKKVPYWMKEGISQLQKGKKHGYELISEK